MTRVVYLLAALILLLANVSVYRAIFAPTVLTVRVFDVGKGDAVLVQSPSGKTVLIDMGPDAGILRALGSALPMWQRRLDAVVVTSPAARSAGGLSAVESRYKIDKLIRSAQTEEHLSFGDGVSIDILSSPKWDPILHISYGSTIITVSSSTPAGVYISDGKGIK